MRDSILLYTCTQTDRQTRHAYTHTHNTNPSVVVAVVPLVPGLSESAVVSSPLRCVAPSDVAAMGKSVSSAAAADDDASCKE